MANLAKSGAVLLNNDLIENTGSSVLLIWKVAEWLIALSRELNNGSFIISSSADKGPWFLHLMMHANIISAAKFADGKAVIGLGLNRPSKPTAAQ